MTMTMVDSPLLRMVQSSPTIWYAFGAPSTGCRSSCDVTMSRHHDSFTLRFSSTPSGP